MATCSLSICIPTYNFGQFIGETLTSIVDQMTDEVEIVVLDGASTDNTSDIVQKYQRLCGKIRYHRLEARGGIDRDMARSVDLAEGEYCWLFSSDDLMKTGAIAKVLTEIKSGRDLYLCRHLECTINMKVLHEHPVLKPTEKSEFDLSNKKERRYYFELAETSEAFFSFMGGIIIKRSKWNSVPINSAFVGSCWAHAARIFELLISNGFSLKYIPQPILCRRGDNDSFAKSGLVNRYRIGIDGYHAIADTFLGHGSVEAFHVRRVIRREFGFRKFMYAKLLCEKTPAVEDKRLLDSLIHKTFCDFSLRGSIILLAYFLIPVWLYAAVRKVLGRD